MTQLPVQQTDILDYASLACACEKPDITATFKLMPEDFEVEEQLPFELSGQGEHVWLYIQKTGTNTDWLAQQLARHARVKPNNVGYAGLKDRHAIARQWFSVHLPGAEAPDWNQLALEGIKLLEVKRHQRKLRRGAAKLNRFNIRLRALDGPIDDLIHRCNRIQQQGVPNYFGPQRFGHDLANLASAERYFRHPAKRLPRHKRSLYLSAARAWLFNQIVSQRVSMHTWNSRMQGDVFMLAGKRACFRDDGSAELDQRIINGAIHPTAILWGEGESDARDDCLQLEQAIINASPLFKTGLLNARVEQQRRACRVIPQNMAWAMQDDCFSLSFGLPAGSYATAVLRELVLLNEPDHATIGTETEQKALLV